MFGQQPEPLAQQIVREGPRILEEVGEEEGVEIGRRTLRFQFLRQLEGNLTDTMMEKLEREVHTSFYLRYSYTYRLRNVENGKVILFSKNLPGSPWINALQGARNWIEQEEAS